MNRFASFVITAGFVFLFNASILANVNTGADKTPATPKFSAFANGALLNDSTLSGWFARADFDAIIDSEIQNSSIVSDGSANLSGEIGNENNLWANARNAAFSIMDSVKEVSGYAQKQTSALAPETPTEGEKRLGVLSPLITTLTEDFNFSGLLTSNGWSAHSGTTNPISTTAGLTYSGYIGSGIGNAALVGNLGGEDDNLPLSSPQTGNGTVVYYSFLVNVNDAAASKTGDYFIHIGNRSSATNFTAFAGRVFAKIVSGNVNFGLSNTTTPTYGTTNFSKNTTYLLIVKYTINTGGSDSEQLWVIPSGVPASEVAAGTPEVTDTTTAGQDTINAIALRQGSATTQPQAIVDGIRVGSTWADIAPPPPSVNLSVSSNSGSEAAATAITVTATASSAVVGDQTVDLAVTGTEITLGDYSLVPDTPTIAVGGVPQITILSGATTGSATFTVVDDSELEGPETATITASNPTSGITLGATISQDIAIADNDDQNGPTITYTPIPNTTSTGPIALSASVTDNVAVSSVKIFYAVNGLMFVEVACSAGMLPVYDCTIPGQMSGSAVAYYVSATDSSGNTETYPGSTSPDLYTVGAATVPTGVFRDMSLSNGATLGGDIAVSGVLTLGGIVNTGANTLGLACTATVSGGGATNYVVGNLKKAYCATGSFTYPVGTTPDSMLVDGFGGTPPATEYTPFTANVTALATVPSTLTVSVTDAFLPDSDVLQSASRYWTVTETGDLTANISFTYLDVLPGYDVNGDETAYKVLRREGTTTAIIAGGVVDSAMNTGSATGVTEFSGWSAGNLATSAAPAAISGRVVTAYGQGIRNATVMLSGGALEQPIYVRTGSFGYYEFPNLPSGLTYFVTVRSKRFEFSNPTQVVTLTSDLSGLDFQAEPGDAGLRGDTQSTKEE